MAQKNNIFAKRSLAMHKRLRGKIAVQCKAPLKNKDDLSLYYTPGVGAVSSYVAEHKQSIRDYTMKGNTVAVISDGSAVLGLGNIGPEGALPVMEGKAMIFKTFADIDAIPLVLATQNTEEIIQTIKNIAPGFGGINLEDISAPRCFEIERRLIQELDIPVFHDDQRGTAMVVLAGLINAMKVTQKKMDECRIVISGAGAAGTAITRLLHLYAPQAMIVLVDSEGIIGNHRVEMNSEKRLLLDQGIIVSTENGNVQVALSRADVFIGVSKPNLLKARDIRQMNDKAVVFALANPIPEIMPDEAIAGGAMVVATGRSDFANQINNSLGFPGIFRGALDNRVREITDKMLLLAARRLADLTKKPTVKQIIPQPFTKGVVEAVASAIKE
ncbi:MAG: NAD(P)-dependent malic enzyme [Minisyncoccota bacterium]